MSADNVIPLHPGADERAPILERYVETTRDIEEVWCLRAQVLEHVKAIEELAKRMIELPRMWGVVPQNVAGYLGDVDAMLTPAADCDCDPEDDPKPGVRGLCNVALMGGVQGGEQHQALSCCPLGTRAPPACGAAFSSPAVSWEHPFPGEYKP
jgi:hypothetical protein